MIHQKTINGRLVNSFLAGEGPIVLFVHGFPLDHSMWRFQLESLANDFQVIAPDLRAFGKSEGGDETTHMSEFADDLAALISTLAVDEPITLCGLSMGGYIAWQFVERHRHLLNRLILCDTKASADSDEAIQTRHETADRVLSEGPDFLADAMVEKLFSSQTISQNSSIVEETQQVIRRTSSQTIASALRGMAARPDMSAILPTIDIPTLVICGEDDAITTCEEMETMSQQIPNAHFIKVENAGHMAPLEQPEIVNSAIREFLINDFA